jgi:hypothetical protein
MADTTEIVGQENEEPLLAAFRARLIQKVPGLNLNNCRIGTSDQPAYFPCDPFCVVSMGDVDFNGAAFVGGTIQAETTVAVAVCIRNLKDLSLGIEPTLFDPVRGLLTFWRPAVTRALLSHDSCWGKACGDTPWEPASGGNRILVDQLEPIRWSAIYTVPGDKESSVPFHRTDLFMRVVYQWALWAA